MTGPLGYGRRCENPTGDVRLGFHSDTVEWPLLAGGQSQKFSQYPSPLEIHFLALVLKIVQSVEVVVLQEELADQTTLHQDSIESFFS